MILATPFSSRKYRSVRLVISSSALTCAISNDTSNAAVQGECRSAARNVANNLFKKLGNIIKAPSKPEIGVRERSLVVLEKSDHRYIRK